MKGGAVMDQIPVVWIWLIVAVACGIIEAATAGIATIWFAIGALGAMLAAALGLGTVWQMIIFLAGSTVLLIFTRPIAVKYLKIGAEKTNADRLIGKIGIVTETVDNIAAGGRVTVMGQSWAAVSESGEKIDIGCEVEVVKITGVKLVIKNK